MHKMQSCRYMREYVVRSRCTHNTGSGFRLRLTQAFNSAFVTLSVLNGCLCAQSHEFKYFKWLLNICGFGVDPKGKRQTQGTLVWGFQRVTITVFSTQCLLQLHSLPTPFILPGSHTPSLHCLAGSEARLLDCSGRHEGAIFTKL